MLNSVAPIGKDTREAVQAAIAQLSFVPSSAARRMRSQRSGLIWLVTGAISMPPEPTQPELIIVQGIQKALASSGMTLMIADTGADPNKATPLIDIFMRYRGRGTDLCRGIPQAREPAPAGRHADGVGQLL